MVSFGAIVVLWVGLLRGCVKGYGWFICDNWKYMYVELLRVHVLHSVDVAAGVLAWEDAVDAGDKRVESAVIGSANTVELDY